MVVQLTTEDKIDAEFNRLVYQRTRNITNKLEEQNFGRGSQEVWLQWVDIMKEVNNQKAKGIPPIERRFYLVQEYFKRINPYEKRTLH